MLVVRYKRLRGNPYVYDIRDYLVGSDRKQRPWRALGLNWDILHYYSWARLEHLFDNLLVAGRSRNTHSDVRVLGWNVLAHHVQTFWGSGYGEQKDEKVVLWALRWARVFSGYMEQYMERDMEHDGTVRRDGGTIILEDYGPIRQLKLHVVVDKYENPEYHENAYDAYYRVTGFKIASGQGLLWYRAGDGLTFIPEVKDPTIIDPYMIIGRNILKMFSSLFPHGESIDENIVVERFGRLAEIFSAPVGTLPVDYALLAILATPWSEKQGTWMVAIVAPCGIGVRAIITRERGLVDVHTFRLGNLRVCTQHL